MNCLFKWILKKVQSEPLEINSQVSDSCFMHYSPKFCSAFSEAPGHISRILDIKVGVGGEASKAGRGRREQEKIP